jgi:hypothetical protein
MKVNPIKVLLAIYATIWTGGFIYGFIREFRKEVASKPTLDYKPSAEFKEIINHYENKQKVNA